MLVLLELFDQLVIPVLLGPNCGAFWYYSHWNVVSQVPQRVIRVFDKSCGLWWNWYDAFIQADIIPCYKLFHEHLQWKMQYIIVYNVYILSLQARKLSYISVLLVKLCWAKFIWNRNEICMVLGGFWFTNCYVIHVIKIRLKDILYFQEWSAEMNAKKVYTW